MRPITTFSGDVMGAKAIRAAISAVYETVGLYGSRSPEGLDLPVGGELAERLGYSAEELRHAPRAALQAFVGAAPLVDEIPPDSEGWIVDLGCGAGLDSWILGSRGHRVVALDASASMLSRVTTGAAPTRLVAVRAFLPSVPLRTGCASRVLLNGVANLIQDGSALLREIHRILQPGGQVLIADLVVLGVVPEELKALPEAWAWCLGGATTPKGWVEALESSGFGSVSFRILEEFSPFGRATLRAVRR